MSISSHSGPEWAPRTGPSIYADRASLCSDAVRGLAAEAALAVDNLVTRASSPDATPAELLSCTVAIEHCVQQANAALVVLQRSQGKPLTELEPLMNVTADRLRKKYPPRAVERDLAARARTSRTSPPTITASPAPTNFSLRHPHQRLACALTLMWKQSGLPQHALAQRMNIHRSYISRILSGTRPVTLRNVRAIAQHCQGDAELVLPLWDVTADPQDRHTADPVQALRLYLRALHYAAGSPSNERLLESAGHTISTAELKQAFLGPGTPDWPVVCQLATALQSLPEAVHPLWRSARSGATSVSSYPADAFG
ncbi:helix-turn-helix transcriptional regulator (plasmid) [Streptomyces sp. NBC_01324]|uniref:helix-turn-helix domain-containing protein n=1 Tax=Streptomyces sp. NBC_01324 TaxID=2903826 RepID=UPI002E12958D|nr:helix-turn-helix transcriptional regulator [Streptomyces sp. NBC_01324]